MSPKLVRAVAIGAALLVALPASAGPQKSVSVSYSDLNLASAAGKKAFEGRIARAADKVCGAPASPRDLVAGAHRKRCVVAALESARPAVELALRNAATQQLAAREQSVRVAP